MKKVFFLFLCFIGLYAENEPRFFIGFGSGYSLKSKFSAVGPSLSLDDKTNTSREMEFLKFESIMGFERVYSKIVSARTYINAGYNAIDTYDKRRILTKKLLSIIDIGWNHDIIFNFPLSTNIQFRFYGGMGIGIDYYRGALVHAIKKMRVAFDSQNIEYKKFNENFVFLRLAFNLGTQLLLAQHHIFEFAMTASSTIGDDKPILLKIKFPEDRKTSRFEVDPPIILSARYIYRF